ncbi:uncharacterized protein MYCFIDRAFT_133498 [Pseudocercospora fijiensis CIRAD86]|uniref:Nucleoporin Nup82 n=1 Tax=Pseudocercospora fijiensis (strain CIRAD86) TaxID=383855 RepID=M3B5B1_PSEFD|nr:uncharacterized protein MYCFIDRAFT_133498 [Pseudocercospora fijiensis CIRAD86]EME84553.1 hypothetical protein MYCFIDRAFT_133498 [Pseudocercospora fijiensis CIRAD86]
MPKVIQRAPKWLDHGQAAYDFFQPANKSSINGKARAASELESAKDGPSKRIAHRGTEIFYATGNELRWADVALLKEAGEGGIRPSRAQPQKSPQTLYKSLHTSIPSNQSIQQISVSPTGEYIAILTKHLCRVCILPPPEHLNFPEQQTLKLKSFTVGPTAHVLEQSPLVSALWHPLSPSGNALLTITLDAVVRLWELDIDNRASFNEPSLAVDLRKLARATSSRDDLAANKYGVKKGYSLDDEQMRVSASCFGGTGQEDEDGWSSMTLWIAMAPGDVYALCPFLPSQFWLSPTVLPSLTTSVVAKARVHEHSQQSTELEKLIATHQRKWLAELDDQDPSILPGLRDAAVYSRPEKPASMPRLQGPFEISPEPDSGDITDIHVIAPNVSQEDLFDDDENFDDLAIDEGLSVGVVCLSTNTGKVHICLNLEGVEAEWLPGSSRNRALYQQSDENVKTLLLYETVHLAPDDQQGDEAWPTFTPSPADRYEIFSTQPTGIYNLSLRPWVRALEDELSAPVTATEGIDFRMNLILESSLTTVSRLTAEVDEPLDDINAAISILDASNLGYITLSSSGKTPIAAILDVPVLAAHPYLPDVYEPRAALTAAEERAPYQPAEVFFHASKLPGLLESWRRESANGAVPGDIKGLVNFSPYTLQKMTEAHRVLSSETHMLGLAAADLFRRCERMINEMKAQIERVRELSNRVNSVTGDDEFPEQTPGEPELVRGGKSKVENRVRQRQEKTREIHERVENLRKKMRGLGSKELSAKERAFADEVERISKTVMPLSTNLRNGEDTVASRVDAVREVYAQLKEQAESVQKELEAKGEAEAISSRPSTANGTKAWDYKQRKMEEVWRLLERETALIEATTLRLENLQAGAA